MTTIEAKASLLNSIQSINDINVIEEISRYVRKALRKNYKGKISSADLVIDPEVADIVKNMKGGPAIDDKAAIHKHWEEKYV